MTWLKEVDRGGGGGGGGGGGRDAEEEEKDGLVEVVLEGKPPWGFTLKGGREHREPLVITKVEVGSAAAGVRLLAGDEMVRVNGVELGGWRKEAISLVKSARQTLALVVRRKNEAASRPHSWHSSKLTEGVPEPPDGGGGGSGAAPAPVWQPMHEARPRELPVHGEQSDPPQPSSRVRPAVATERPDRPAHSCSPEPPSGGPACRDAGFSCFSGSSSPPGPDAFPPTRKGAAGTENMFFKGLLSEGPPRHAEPQPRYLQPPLGSRGWEKPRAEDQQASRVSFPGRAGVGPVWQVPERRKTPCSPPLPLAAVPPAPHPPLRSDSFAATKVFPYSDGLAAHRRSHGRGPEAPGDGSNRRALGPRRAERTPETARLEAAKDPLLHPDVAAVRGHGQLQPGKLFSLSSNDVRQGQSQSHAAHPASHQRQHSDESPFYPQGRAAPEARRRQQQQSVGSYYRSLQDIPADGAARRPARLSAALQAPGAPGAPGSGNGGPVRHGDGAPARRGLLEGLAPARCDPGKDSGSTSALKSSVKSKPAPPSSQTPYADGAEPPRPTPSGKAFPHQHPFPEPPCSLKSSRPADWPNGNAKQQTSSLQGGTPRPQDPWVPQEDHRISPSKTPFLHSLALESRSLVPRQPAVAGGDAPPAKEMGDGGRSPVARQPAAAAAAAPPAPQEPPGDSSGKPCRRGDRYATTLRHQIQQKRAQLQKSRSAVTLTCGDEGEDGEEEEEEEEETETSTSSSSNTYKDHLKEAQARVLQATSFQRRDLEPVGPEGKAGRPSRVAGRKRFPPAKRVHSFSEPDKMDQVGTGEGGRRAEAFGRPRAPLESRPAFPKPALKSGPPSSAEAGGPDARRPARGPEDPGPGAEPEPAAPDQQRLGTFAEYQATWGWRRRPAAEAAAAAKGRYRSAENILDPGAEKAATCVHERSRSSPSADFYVPVVDPVNNECMKPRHGQQDGWLDRSKESGEWQESGSRPAHPDPQPDPRPDHPPGTAAMGPPSPGSQRPLQTLSSRRLPSEAAPPPPPSSSSSASFQESTAGARAEAPAAEESLLPPGPSPKAVARQPRGASAAVAPPPPPPPAAPEAGGGSRPSVVAAAPPGRSRSPSPQFEPRRLTDRPPHSVCETTPGGFQVRKEQGEGERSPPARKVPVRIVHSESSERQGRAYLPHLHPQQTSSSTTTTTTTSSASTSTLPGPQPPPGLGSLSHPSSSSSSSFSSSLFSVYTRPPPLPPPSPPPPPPPSPPPAQQTPGRPEATGDSAGSGDDGGGTGGGGGGGGEEDDDAKREELARDIMGRDRALADVLDRRGMRTTMDLMEGLFPQGGSQPRRRAPAAGPRVAAEDRAETACVSSSLVPSSSYYSTSAPKAELLIKMKDMREELQEQEDSEEELDVDLVSKKCQLIRSLAQKLEVLREARLSLLDDVGENEALGREVEAAVQRLCPANQLEKFRMFVGDLDKVVSLLLSLSGRLARVENALGSGEDPPPDEKRTLTEKRALLLRQHADARELKENLDRRERLVSGAMEARLDALGLADYRHFVKMKAALAAEQRMLEDKVKLGEEQLKCLLDSLPPEQRPPV